MGPQVGYYVPQILMEQELHGPGIDARGASFAGINLVIQLGHGRDYAWSATTATSDNVDTFAEVLCQDNFHYSYRGKCLPMEKLEKTESWAPNALDSTEAGSQTLVAYRTVHGVVFARGKVGKRKVAFVRQRSTYFHEADSVIGFAQLNEPGVVTGVEGFKNAVSNIGFLFNWAYVDSDDIGYALSGAMPQRSLGVSPDFPILGTGQYDWKGFNPTTQTAEWLPFSKHPQAVNPEYLVSWNNKQAPGWAAADDKYSYGPLFRSQMIADKVRSATKGPRKITIAQLVQSMSESATQDVRGYRLLPTILNAVGKPKSPALRKALATLSTWNKKGAHRRDLDRDGVYEENAAVQLMDAWWPKLVEGEFKSALGAVAYERLEGMLELGDVVGVSPNAPAFSDGWWGYVSKDLRGIFGPKPKAPWSQSYCGKGSKKACRAMLQRTLAAALKVTPAQLYGGGTGRCAANPQPSCYDQNRPQVTSGITLNPFPFQNRPTFQQVVQLSSAPAALKRVWCYVVAHLLPIEQQMRHSLLLDGRIGRWARRPWSAVDEFIGETLVPQDEGLQRALDAAEAAGLPAIQVSPPQGKLLALLVRLVGARTVLEFGTLGGYSTILMARALSGGGQADHARGEPGLRRGGAGQHRAGRARRRRRAAGRAGAGEPRRRSRGDAPFDLVFIDADKVNTPNYFAWALDHVRPGGLIVADNVVRGGTLAEAASTDDATEAQRRLHEMLAGEPRVFATTIQTVGVKGYDGFTIALVDG